MSSLRYSQFRKTYIFLSGHKPKLSDHRQHQRALFLSYLIVLLYSTTLSPFSYRANPPPFHPDNNVGTSDKNVTKTNSNTIIKFEQDDTNNETSWPRIHPGWQQLYRLLHKPYKTSRKYSKLHRTSHCSIPTRTTLHLISCPIQDHRPLQLLVMPLTTHGMAQPMPFLLLLLSYAYAAEKSIGEHKTNMAS